MGRRTPPFCLISLSRSAILLKCLSWRSSRLTWSRSVRAARESSLSPPRRRPRLGLPTPPDRSSLPLFAEPRTTTTFLLHPHRRSSRVQISGHWVLSPASHTTTPAVHTARPTCRAFLLLSASHCARHELAQRRAPRASRSPFLLSPFCMLWMWIGCATPRGPFSSCLLHTHTLLQLY